MNQVSLLGRLVKDIEIITTKNDKIIGKFTLAVNRKFKKDETDFINCIAFGKTAEIMAQYLSKGSQIAVTGGIQTGSYEAQDGSKRYTTDIIVDSFDFCSNAKQTGFKQEQNGKVEEMFELDVNDDCPF